MQQHHSLNAVHLAGNAVTVRLRRQPLALAVLAASLAAPSSMAWAEDASSKGPLELGATAITDTRLGEITEGSRSYTTGATRTATRMALSPRETPQSVSVITRQQMDDQNLTSISDVLGKTPGVTVTKLDSNRTSFQARGFEIDNFQIDGVPAAFRFGNGIDQTDMVIYDRVEVLRGATGLLSGFGSPSATVNLVRKRPTRELSGYASLGAGSWDTYRGEFDIGGALTPGGNVRGRFVTAYEDSQSFMDNLSEKKQVMYGIVEADLSEDTLLSVGLSRQTNRPEGSSWGPSTPLLDNNGNDFAMSRSFNPAAKWSQWDNTADNLFVTLEQRLANDWTIKASASRTETDSPATLGSAASGFPDAATGGGMGVWLGRYRYKTDQNAYDLYASGPFQLLGREHELVAGISHRDIRAHEDNWPFFFGSANIYQWAGDFPEPDWGRPLTKVDTRLREEAAYLTARFKPTDKLSVIVGSRLSNWELDSTRLTTATDQREKVQDLEENGVVVPYAGVVYDLNDTWSVYGSYTSIFKPHESEQDASGKMIEPEEGDAYELGIKSEFFDGRLNASLALFEVQQDNLAEFAATDPVTNRGIYRSIQGAKTRGFELEVAGELTPDWHVQGGFTHRITRDGDDHKISTIEPENLLRLSTTYRLPGVWNKLTVGGSANWQSKVWKDLDSPAGNGETERYTQSSYLILDAMARYQVTDQLSVTLNGNNLTDKKYFNNLGFYNGGYYGDPRNFMLTTRYDF
ncbi:MULTISPECIES: TonB-dependent siderophore receptor [Pseudomonas]|uniref:TonB-dependent siderophore receptor n=1 Tax=Pseudomonas guariconensis TaxID=1288410 RepID=UPI00209836C8|nr:MULTISPECIES: TonB-dependent siderophore receptor [Pseudomonas]MCO7595716.1 TonB-dependent siderophore receptor [Pseudomonas guariconensis]MCU7220377.1 TonB-dependent siderophore receptor [Pseudomonas brassicacearum]